MKKMILVPVIAILTAGILFAQSAPSSITDNRIGIDAVQTVSTEARYSAGRFGSYIDDFIGVNDYDGQIKTFLYLGGFGADSSAGDVTVTGKPSVALSGGFATALKSLYLGIYYGGDLIKAKGSNDGKSKDGTVSSEATWNNYVAVLLGNLPFGALRLDLIMENDKDDTTKVGDKKTSSHGNGIMTALTWGTNSGKLSPHATVGIQWPDYTFSKPSTTSDYTIEQYSGAGFAVKGGAGYTLNDTSSLSGDITIQGTFGSQTNEKSPDSKSTLQGAFWTFIDLGYSKKLALGDKLTLGLKPNATIALRIYDPNTTTGGDKKDASTETTFETKLGLDTGLQFKATQKTAIYTGVSLNIFDWVAWGLSAGDPKRGGGAWKIDGLGFDWAPDAYNKSKLGLGLVHTPDEHLSIGFGLNALLDRLVVIDLENMEIRAGDLWENLNDGSTGTGGFLGGPNVWKNVNLDLTVSYTF